MAALTDMARAERRAIHCTAYCRQAELLNPAARRPVTEIRADRTSQGQGGRCIDVLTAFNGPTGKDNAYKKGLMNEADCFYPSGRGHQLIAELLYRAGLKPLR